MTQGPPGLAGPKATRCGERTLPVQTRRFVRFALAEAVAPEPSFCLPVEAEALSGVAAETEVSLACGVVNPLGMYPSLDLGAGLDGFPIRTFRDPLLHGWSPRGTQSYDTPGHHVNRNP